MHSISSHKATNIKHMIRIKNNNDMYFIANYSSIRLLFSGSGTFTTKFLGFASSGVSHQHGTVISDQDLFNIAFGLLIDEFLVESYDSFADGLTNCVDLGCVTTTSDSDSDVKICETFSSQQLHRL
jgi:hypothetical protein